MPDASGTPENLEPRPQAFSRKSDADAFKLPPEEIHRQLTANIDAATVPDKDAIAEFIADAKRDEHPMIHREMERLESDLSSGDPEIRARARQSLENLGKFTESSSSILPEENGPDFSTGIPEIYPPEGTPAKSRLNSAFSKLMRVFGRRDDPSAEILANRQWNDLRDPGTRERAIKEVLGDDEVK